jgi:hypothetical protein
MVICLLADGWSFLYEGRGDSSKVTLFLKMTKCFIGGYFVAISFM